MIFGIVVLESGKDWAPHHVKSYSFIIFSVYFLCDYYFHAGDVKMMGKIESERGLGGSAREPEE